MFEFLGIRELSWIFLLIADTVVRTNKGRTNKGQITFFSKIYWGLIRDKYLEKFSTKKNIADFLFRLGIF